MSQPLPLTGAWLRSERPPPHRCHHLELLLDTRLMICSSFWRNLCFRQETSRSRAVRIWGRRVPWSWALKEGQLLRCKAPTSQPGSSLPHASAPPSSLETLCSADPLTSEHSQQLLDARSPSNYRTLFSASPHLRCRPSREWSRLTVQDPPLPMPS